MRLPKTAVLVGATGALLLLGGGLAVTGSAAGAPAPAMPIYPTSTAVPTPDTSLPSGVPTIAPPITTPDGTVSPTIAPPITTPVGPPTTIAPPITTPPTVVTITVTLPEGPTPAPQ